MSSPASPSGSVTSSVPDGHLWLVLLPEDPSFYLQIPLDIIRSLCLKPRKYLLFLGWCILGVEGTLALERNGDAIDTHEDLDDGGIYYYVVAAGTDLSQAVDLEVIKLRTNVPSETTNTPDEFRTNLLERDVCCAWTGAKPDYGAGLHIIPYKRGSEWFRLIVENRPRYSEDVTELKDINDIRNGIFAAVQIHNAFDPRRVVILKTPNHIIGLNDIPPRHGRTRMPHNVVYPPSSRYTLQRLVTPDEFIEPLVPNNSDAAFKKYNRKPKPSELLLHYNYGAAAVKCWGHGKEVLQKRVMPPRPPVPLPAPTRPPRTIHDRDIAVSKRDTARAPDTAGVGNSSAGAGTGELVESEGQAMWDEDDVMLFFWGNSQAAKERSLKKVHEDTQRMEQWREGVP
ncbi:hypothetical protein L208DRAFT_1360845 [Tricholoma matsutake]|nr:hypothetical protein L208DRAFT_1360845 [Tricholoma matsutake 945]